MENDYISDIGKTASGVAQETANIYSAINKHLFSALSAANDDDEIYRWLEILNDYTLATKGELYRDDYEDDV